MSYNPYTEPCRDLHDEIKRIDWLQYDCIDKLDKHHRIDVPANVQAVREIEHEIGGLELELQTLTVSREEQEKHNASLEAAAAPGFNPFRWVDERRRAAARQRQQLRQSIAQIKQRQKTIGQRLADLHKELDQPKKLLDFFRNFDRSKLQSQIAILETQSRDLKAQRYALLLKRDQADAELREPLNQRENLLSYRDAYQRRLAAAERYESSLSSARSKHERRQIHRKCKAEFGTGSPDVVVAEMRSKLESTDRDLRTVEARLNIIRERLTAALSASSSTAGRCVTSGVDASLCCTHESRSGAVLRIPTR